MQAAELYNYQEQEETSGADRDEEVLPVLQPAYDS
jgi:hypothetical protein